MNPHFTYNFLSLVKSEIKSNPLGASDYLIKYSRLLRSILDNSTQNYVQLNTEMEILKKYIDLQKLRFPQNISFEVEYNNLEEDDLIFIPPMIFQPILENSIMHGFKGIEYEGRIQIILTKKERFISCEVRDNGSGLAETKSSERTSSTILISEFLERTTNRKLEHINKPHGERGTITKFTLPFKNSQID